jgi:calcineurin-like phosphoesterase family protein
MTEFAISDLHLSHRNMLKFARKDNGEALRPFLTLEEADETLIENWNKDVGPNDTVYCLGDFTFGGKANIAKHARRLNGKIKLALGNHDYDAKDYVDHFANVASWYETTRYRRALVLQHYPLHWTAFRSRFREDDTLCIHGHLHDVLTGEPYHVNVCVENTNFRPRALEEIVDSLR